MRLQGAFLLSLLFVAAIILILRGQETESGLQGVANAAANLREANVEGRMLDPIAAEEIVEAMTSLVVKPELIKHHVEDLRSFAATAASWADASPSPSLELNLAVAIRSAANELRAYATHGSGRNLELAQRQLTAARAALEGDAPIGNTASGVRDRLENIQQSHREKLQQLDETLNQ
ncbi:MAG: hypothetical protein GY906_02795 [bacterium]|nr:hypothetical protein [bacterium]